MRTSDARYRHVQRAKRPAFDYTALIDAMRAAKAGDLDPLEQAVGSSTAEFTHVMLASGKTANDFRRNFRVGSHAVNILRANELVARDRLVGEKLDGMVLMRLSREQHKNVKLRWAKLRNQDRLCHDPQGRIWTDLLRGSLGVIGQDEVIGRLIEVRDTGVKLTAKADAFGSQEAVERSSRELVRYVASPAWQAQLDWDDERTNKEARDAFYGAKRTYLEGCEWHGGVVDAWRKKIEEQLVIAEAYCDGDDVKAASCNPDTSKRHSTEAQLLARFSRIDRLMGEKWRAERDAIREARRIAKQNFIGPPRNFEADFKRFAARYPRLAAQMTSRISGGAEKI